MKKLNIYFLIIASILLILSLYLPYINVTSYDILDKTSQIIYRGESPNMYGTIYYGFESEEYFWTIGLTSIVFSVGHYARGIFSNIIMIVLAIVFILLMILIYALADAGWGKPFGNQLLIGYTLTLIGSSVIVVESIIYSFTKNKTVL